MKHFAKEQALFTEDEKAPAKEVRRKKLQGMHQSIVRLLEENDVPKDKIQALDEVFTKQGIDLDQVMSNMRNPLTAEEVRRKKLNDMRQSIVKLLKENKVPKDKIQALDEVFTKQGIDLDQVMSNIPDLPTSNAEKN